MLRLERQGGVCAYLWLRKHVQAPGADLAISGDTDQVMSILCSHHTHTVHRMLQDNKDNRDIDIIYIIYTIKHL